MSTEHLEPLHAPLAVEFDYTRSYGPVLSQFAGGLVGKQILGSVSSDGTIVVPPLEYDPTTHEATAQVVPVGDEGVVTTWAWVAEPVEQQPLAHPFAYALVLLDGADRPMLHAVDAGSVDSMETGMRVKARWRDERIGAITDIEAFVPVTAAVPVDALEHSPLDVQPSDVDGFTSPTRLAYDYAASREESKFFRGLAEGRIIGQRCPKCQKVYVPPRGACPVDGVPTAEEVELSQTGTVTTFCIVNVPFLGQKIKPPYVSAYILLDGADIAFLHLILDVEASEVRMGMRVEAVWKPRDQWGTTIENISHFRPTGEPDADYETYKQHL